MSRTTNAWSAHYVWVNARWKSAITAERYVAGGGRPPGEHAPAAAGVAPPLLPRVRGGRPAARRGAGAAGPDAGPDPDPGGPGGLAAPAPGCPGPGGHAARRDRLWLRRVPGVRAARVRAGRGPGAAPDRA